MTSDPPWVREVMVDVLVYHWRTNTSGCGCGWAELGRSHPEHVIEVYEASVSAYLQEAMRRLQIAIEEDIGDP